ncbi:hypothetical protein ABW20_dc0103222 [Dactylellina cionopaga]|nr:hypothetical protein ABW20_dc0103222 [Dactylellina cionopaga]
MESNTLPKNRIPFDIEDSISGISHSMSTDFNDSSMTDYSNDINTMASNLKEANESNKIAVPLTILPLNHAEIKKEKAFHKVTHNLEIIERPTSNRVTANENGFLIRIAPGMEETITGLNKGFVRPPAPYATRKVSLSSSNNSKATSSE